METIDTVRLYDKMRMIGGANTNKNTRNKLNFTFFLHNRFNDISRFLCLGTWKHHQLLTIENSHLESHWLWSLDIPTITEILTHSKMPPPLHDQRFLVIEPSDDGTLVIVIHEGRVVEGGLARGGAVVTRSELPARRTCMEMSLEAAKTQKSRGSNGPTFPSDIYLNLLRILLLDQAK